MHQTEIGNTVKVNPSILAFKPRQVVLSLKPPATASTMKLDDGSKNNNKKTLLLKQEHKTLLFHSIAQYLERSGFSKTLKKFISEAKIQKDDLNDSSFDLEDIFSKFLDMCNDFGKNSKTHKVQELKKTDKSVVDKSTNSETAKEIPRHDNTVSVEVKSKEKKRNKKKQSNLDSESIVDKATEESLPEATEEKSKDVVLKDGEKLNDSETDDKLKDKKKNKKKKNKVSSDPVVQDNGKKIDSENGDLKTLKEDVVEKPDKSSKKRKRVASEDDAPQPNGEKLVEVSNHLKTEESKRRKTEGSEENSQTGEAQKISTKELNGQSNGSLEEHGEKSSVKKTNKQKNGSAEPKSAKHFQRIKVEEVVFSDERLKDNSYWAKDGAEIGYGAKAQDILGQVRGRDFRHEKTKKKRGSYRGGPIDLQSHSVKFNYSDDN